MTKYVISSASFASKKKALAKIKEWHEDGTLDNGARIYEVKKTYLPIYTNITRWGLNEETRKKRTSVEKRTSKTDKGSSS